ncbi:hypothetical protein [Arthrobacter sp. UYP6]|uniref:hypothetical protein n=1 Tax=Arthrobacter sp. UYP6 TaxID=1756378 RepID=UPI003398359A
MPDFPAPPTRISAPTSATLHTAGPAGNGPGGVTHAPYRREPYVRCRTPSSFIDGKAAAWTRTFVLLHWIDDDGRAHNRWVPAGTVRRVARDDSTWQDPYDDWSFYYPASSPGSSPARFAAAA